MTASATTVREADTVTTTTETPQTARPRRRPRRRIASLALLIAMAASLTGVAAARPAAAGNGVGQVWSVVNAGGGVYWRWTPDWNNPRVWPGHGVYTGDEVYLACYQWGGASPTGNHLWYWAGNLSRNMTSSGAEYGWVSDSYLNTPGTAANPQPQTLPCG